MCEKSRSMRIGFLQVFCTGFTSVLLNWFILPQGGMITTLLLCMQRQMNPSIAFTHMRWDQNVHRNLCIFFPYSVTTGLFTTSPIPPLLSFCAVMSSVCNASPTGIMWHILRVVAHSELFLQQIITKLCSVEDFFLVVVNAFKLLLKLPHEVWTSNIKYILVVRELY